MKEQGAKEQGVKEQGVQVDVVLGDITAERVDAVVNPVSGAMRGGPGIDGAMHRAAGPDLLGECVRRFPNGLETG